MKRRSVRTRTAITATAIVLIGSTLGAIATVFLLRASLLSGLEDTAEFQADQLVRTLETSGVPDSLDSESPTGFDEETVAQVLDTSGRVVLTSDPSLPPLTREGNWQLDDEPYVVETEAATEAEGNLVVAVGVNGEESMDAVTETATLLAIGVPIIGLLVAATTWWLTGRAMRPVEHIRQEVETISGSGLHRRVPEPESRDEIHRLATTMNAMLDRLEDSATQQRQFVADASHELKSPIASLRQAAEVVSAHPDSMEKAELVDLVKDESVRMQRLVEQLLLLARADSGSLESVDVDIDDLALGVLGQRGDITVRHGQLEAARIRGDRLALEQVVRNLVDNAVRHASSLVEISVRSAAGNVIIWVDDNGDGIAEADRERVFERFVRLDEARSRDLGGTGLGLAIVRDVAARHRGTVQVETSHLGGARFVVTLPAESE